MTLPLGGSPAPAGRPQDQTWSRTSAHTLQGPSTAADLVNDSKRSHCYLRCRDGTHHTQRRAK
jgi:hypothetical protein